MPTGTFATRALRNGAGIKLNENVRRGTTQFQRCLSRDWLDIGDTANAISTENFLLLGHGLIETLESQFVNGKLSQDCRFYFLCHSEWSSAMDRLGKAAT